MPELPEVEVTRRGFADAIAGARVTRVTLGKPLRWPLGLAPEALQGARVQTVLRRGKYLLMHLLHESGEPGVLLWHLGMSGRLAFLPRDCAAPGVHDHFDLHTTHGVLRLHDPRRFGAVIYAPSEREGLAYKLLAHLGVEPLEPGFDALAFANALRSRRAPIKQVLLAGDVVVGVGNIYASECLFLAGIRPTTSACSISRSRALRLHQAIIDVLSHAVSYGGSTLRDFRDPSGQAGYFQLEAKVYDRAGLPCRVCGTPIRLIRQGTRSSFFCPACQKR